MLAHKHSKAVPPRPRTRRQNHSCDQCRKSKRACDAVSGQRSSCSYCARTKKRCTMEWVRSRAPPSFRTARQQPNVEPPSPEMLFPWLVNETAVTTGYGAWDNPLQPTLTQGLLAWQPVGSNLSGSLLGYSSIPVEQLIDEDESVQEDMPSASTEPLLSTQLIPEPMLADIHDFDIADLGAPTIEFDPFWHETWPTSTSSPSPTSIVSAYIDPQSNLSNCPGAKNSSFMPSDRQSSRMNTPPSLSPLSVDQRMIAKYNNNQMSENLLRIYHDVLEHNLSCWLTETTCPYLLGSPNITPIRAEWGLAWSNRIYQRTLRLDQVAQSCGLLQVTHTEDQTASKALHLAIMAFATQWAQGSHRHREKYGTQSPGDGGDRVINEFDRILQENIWDQAHRALQAVAHLETYRVACAELIFGLTQRPWGLDTQTSGSGARQLGTFCMDLMVSQIRDMINREGPPMFMERAARKMHALKYRFDAFENGFSKPHDCKKDKPGSTKALTPENQATVGLLYWLAVMFDTVSSSMNERPVVVLDEDCQHQGRDELRKGNDDHRICSSNRWDLDRFVPGGLKARPRTRWPCSYEAAAEDIVRSAPVKVILFRHLSYLQNAIRRGRPKTQIEDIISSTLLLYQHWNRTHGAFFAELTEHHDAVPQRIQSWFVVISGHWHLAAMMVADLFEFVDENDLGQEEASSRRVGSQTARRIRMHSARELAVLARIATPDMSNATLGVPQIPQMPDFHHAVNEGTLLTEPWTIILIRAFSKACIIFFGEVNECKSAFGYSMSDLDGDLRRAEECIKGLWLLGKKSDMARKVAEKLSVALARFQNETE
ncbi:putative C6 transcription factor [Aspergillus undulatus]|uniref:putative C6 transcription factor n=1 Tax=Aspergillus undulatus TaxID=1810928 RepID=UPI003CCD0681